MKTSADTTMQLTRVLSVPRETVYTAWTPPFSSNGGDRPTCRLTTELHLTHENLPSEASRDRHKEGWNSAIDNLERLVVS